jgi:dihydrofolate reductase (trimethoprim resistance protein)
MENYFNCPFGCHPVGTRMRKRSGSSWQGKVVGYYSTTLTPVGYCIESEREPGSVQIYPSQALELVEDGEVE